MSTHLPSSPGSQDQDQDQANDYLALLDYRRQVLSLYHEVRELAGKDPFLAHAYWCQFRETLYGQHVQSPLNAAQREKFTGLHYYPYNPAYRFTAQVLLDSRQEGREIGTSRDSAISFHRFGVVELPFGKLEVYWLEGYGGGVFLPLRDGTCGDTTYGGGRYLLDTVKGADLGSGAGGKELILDFNFAYHPSCHYNPYWDCPLAPPPNRLKARIEAGEMSFPGS